MVEEISQFSSEIMENDEQRSLKLAALENLKSTATELLGQVNITISDITSKNPKPDYKAYQIQISDFKLLLEYQSALIKCLDKISELTYLLGKSFISFERSYFSFNKYLEITMQTDALLGEWHNKQVQTLHIDLNKERISKTGIAAAISAVPGLIDDRFKYKILEGNLVQEINSQGKTVPEYSIESKPVYDADIEIVIKEGKCFFLHEASDVAK